MLKAPIVAIAVMIAGFLALGAAIEAQSPPHVFVGEATLDGVIVPDGIVIRAVVNGQPLP